MAIRWQLIAFTLSMVRIASFVQADIYRWDTGEVIPGTEEIVLEAGVDLRDWNMVDRNLRFADMTFGISLEESKFFLLRRMTSTKWAANHRFRVARLRLCVQAELLWLCQIKSASICVPPPGERFVNTRSIPISNSITSF